MKAPLITATILSVSMMANVASAQTMFSFPTGKGGNFIQPGFAAVEGNKFRVGALDILVTQLGYEFQRQNQQSNPTGIFDATTGNLLTSASISGSDQLQGGYYWKAITPLRLTSGREYYIGSLHGSGPGNEYFHNTNQATTSSLIVDLGTWYKVSSTLAGGTWEGSPPRHYVGNFRAQAVPEPLSFTSLGVALLLLRSRKR